MPIVDGLTSAQMIRSFELTPAHSGHSKLAQNNGRIPIIAVSASLVEEDRKKYIDAGFDGWILKPIDFKRLNHLLHGIHDNESRQSSLYVPGEWERGGWFFERGSTTASASSESTPTNEDESKILSAG
jgi:DNA-binding response OmpR family regulator